MFLAKWQNAPSSFEIASFEIASFETGDSSPKATRSYPFHTKLYSQYRKSSEDEIWWFFAVLTLKRFIALEHQTTSASPGHFRPRSRSWSRLLPRSPQTVEDSRISLQRERSIPVDAPHRERLPCRGSSGIHQLWFCSRMRGKRSSRHETILLMLFEPRTLFESRRNVLL